MSIGPGRSQAVAKAEGGVDGGRGEVKLRGMEGPDLSMVMERRKARSLRTPRRCGAMIANKVFGGVGGTGGWQSHRASETRALTAAAAHEGGEPQAAADRGIMTPRCWDGGGAGSGSRQEVQLSCKCPSCDRPQAMRTIKLLGSSSTGAQVQKEAIEREWEGMHAGVWRSDPRCRSPRWPACRLTCYSQHLRTAGSSRER